MRMKMRMEDFSDKGDGIAWQAWQIWSGREIIERSCLYQNATQSAVAFKIAFGSTSEGPAYRVASWCIGRKRRRSECDTTIDRMVVKTFFASPASAHCQLFLAVSFRHLPFIMPSISSLPSVAFPIPPHPLLLRRSQSRSRVGDS